MESPGQTPSNNTVQLQPPASAREARYRRHHTRPVMPRNIAQNQVRNPYSGCYVWVCRSKGCSLRSHRRPSDKIVAEEATLKKISARSRNRADLQQKLVPLPPLSDPTIDGDDELKNLFHQYVTFDMPRIAALLYPPSSTQSPTKAIQARQQAYANFGLLAPVNFLLCASMGHLLELMRCDRLQADKISARLYGLLMQMLREKLNHYKPSEASDLALSVIALSSFDMTLGNYAAVNSHRMALHKLVAHAGLHYLGRSLVYVMTWDRLMAAFTGTASLYAKMPDRRLLRPPKHCKKYGLGFEWSQQELDLDPDVQNLCFDVCRAIEITEAENWTFLPERLHEPYDVSDVQYLYFLRDTINNSCIVLQARDLHNSQKSKPVTLATMIVQHDVLGRNDFTWYPNSIADRLYKTLLEQDLEEVWKENEDVLCWLMCVLLTVKPWANRDLALKLFNNWTGTRLNANNDDTGGTSEVNLCNPEDFVWSKERLDGKLCAALKEIESYTSPSKAVRFHDPSWSGTNTVMVSWSPLGRSETSDDSRSTPSVLHSYARTSSEESD